MTIWYGKYANVKIGTDLGTAGPGTTSNLYATVSGTVYSGECKDVTINPGEAAVSPLYCFGTTVMEESRPDIVTADFTLVFNDIDVWGLQFGTAESAPSGYVRTRGADMTGNKTKYAIAFQLTKSGVGTMNVLLNQAYIVGQGELSLAADGSGEQSFSVACLNEDFYAEDNIA